MAHNRRYSPKPRRWAMVSMALAAFSLFAASLYFNAGASRSEYIREADQNSREKEQDYAPIDPDAEARGEAENGAEFLRRRDVGQLRSWAASDSIAYEEWIRQIGTEAERTQALQAVFLNRAKQSPTLAMKAVQRFADLQAGLSVSGSIMGEWSRRDSLEAAKFIAKNKTLLPTGQIAKVFLEAFKDNPEFVSTLLLQQDFPYNLEQTLEELIRPLSTFEPLISLELLSALALEGRHQDLVTEVMDEVLSSGLDVEEAWLADRFPGKAYEMIEIGFERALARRDPSLAAELHSEGER